MTVSFVSFDEFLNNLGKKLLALQSDTFKAVLTNSAPNAGSDDELADITQISNANGYTTGGVTLSATWAETGSGTGVWKFTCDPFGWTASGGSIGPFRYLVIYDDTSSGDKLLGYVDLGSQTLADGGEMTITPGTDGLFLFSQA